MPSDGYRFGTRRHSTGESVALGLEAAKVEDVDCDDKNRCLSLFDGVFLSGIFRWERFNC